MQNCDNMRFSSTTHSQVIGWLLSNNLLEQVVASNSPYLEDYLQSRLRQSPNDVSLLRLLWRQLEMRGARLDAARVLEHLATMATPGLALDDRLDYLARAIVTVKALPRGFALPPVFQMSEGQPNSFSGCHVKKCST